MHLPGRNDPCPCGSGKKFKRCCGAAAARSSALEPIDLGSSLEDSGYREADRERALHELSLFGLSPQFLEHRRRCHRRLWGPYADRLMNPEHDVWRTWPITLDNVMHHAFVDVPLPVGRTVAEMLLARRDRALAPGERRFLEDFSRSHLSLYEVQEVQPGKGFEALDLWRNERTWIDERTASQQLARWDLLAARMLTRPDGRRVIDNDLWHFRAQAKPALIGRLEEEHARALRSRPEISPEAFLKGASHVFAQAWARSILEPERPKLVSADGDPIELVEQRFALRAGRSVKQRLDGVPELHREDSDSWTWAEERDGAHHMLGWVEIAPGELVVRAMSGRRAAELRARLERELGAALTFVSAKTGSVEEWSERTASGADDAAVLSAEAREVVRLLEERHYQRWVDEPVPALDGRTPRACAADPATRPRVVELLKEFESSMHHRVGVGGSPPIDLRPIWRELGLEPPPPPHTGPLAGAPSRPVDGFDVALARFTTQGGGRQRAKFERMCAIARAARTLPPGGEGLTELACTRRPGRKRCVGRLLVLAERGAAPLRWRCAVCGDSGELANWRALLDDLDREASVQPKLLFPRRAARAEDLWSLLYAAADRFRELAPWQWMLDEEVFGVEDPATGEIAWCCVLGAAGELEGLVAYRGDSGFDLWRRMHEPWFRRDEVLFGQDALSLAFVDREDVSGVERARIRDLGLRYRGHGAWPQVESHAFGRLPRPADDAEAKRLLDCIHQALEIAVGLRRDSAHVAPDGAGRLLVRRRLGGPGSLWAESRIAPPKPIVRAVPAVDRVRVERLRQRLPKLECTWEYDLRAAPVKIAEPGAEPYVPACFLVVDTQRRVPVHFDLERPGDLMALMQEQFLRALESIAVLPARVRVDRAWIEDCLRPLVEGLGIRLERVAELFAMEEVEKELFRFLEAQERSRGR
jgi:hypothetical protein